MRNYKLWSVLLAAVLLCACAVGVLVIGAQAEGTAYVYTVDGVGGSDNCYADINAAMAAAKAKTWAAGDTLTVNITASGTAAATATSNRYLFGIGTIWRADNTMLPITIDGAGTYGFDLDGTGYTQDGAKHITCTNQYTFRNLDLSSWGSVSSNFRAGCAQVTFNNVDFGSGRSLLFSADCSSKAIFSNWTKARFNAMSTDGVLDVSLTFIGVDYRGSATNLISTRNWKNGYTVDYNDLSEDPITPAKINSKIVLGEGTQVTNFCTIAVTGITESLQNYANTLSVEGATVGTVYGIRSSYTAYGNLVTNISSGSVTSLASGPNTGKLYGNVVNNISGGSVGTVCGALFNDAAELHGNATNTISGNAEVTAFYGTANGRNATVDGSVFNTVSGGTITTFYGCGGGKSGSALLTITGDATNTFTGGTVTTFRGGFNNYGVLNGDLTNNFGYEDQSPAPTINGFSAGCHDGGTIGGAIVNNLYAVNVTGTYYLGNRKGTTTSIVNNFYSGFNGSASTGYFGGNSTGSILNNITNNIYGGTFGSNASSTVYCGNASANQTWGTPTEAIDYRIINNISGGTFKGLVYCGGANASAAAATVDSVKNTFSGTVTIEARLVCAGNANAVGTVDNYFQGDVNGTVYGGANSTGATTTVNNHFLSGTVSTFYGGSFGTGSIGTVNNYLGQDDGGVYSGTCRIQTFYGGAGGSNASAINTINNTYYSGTIGNEEATTAGGVVSYGGSAKGTVGIINNTFYGGAFNCGWFYGGNASSNATFDASLHDFTGSECQINNVVKAGAFGRFAAGCNGAAVDTIYNEVGGAAMSDITMYSGAFYCGQGAKSTTTVNNVFNGCISNVYGGSNSNALGTINNSIVEGADIAEFYGANNSSANVGTVNNTVSGGNVGNFYGGYNKPSSGTITAINNTLTGGTIDAFYGGGNTVTVSSADVTIEIGSIVNVLDGATVRLYYGGSYDYISKTGNVVGKYVIGSITNNLISGTINGNTYLGNRKGDVGDITTTLGAVILRGNNIYAGSNSTGSVTGDITLTIGNVTIGGNEGDSKLVPGCASATFAGTPSVTITSGAVITVMNNGQLDLTGADLTAPDFTLNQAQGWLNKTYFKGDVDAANVTVSGGSYGSYTKTGNCTVKGDAVALAGNAEVSLVLTTRIGTKIYLNKDAIDAYSAAFTYKVAMGSTTLASGTYADLVEDDGKYVIEVAGVGLANFGTNIVFTTPIFPTCNFSIRSLATAGAEQYAGDAITAAMFQSIADLGTETIPTYNAVTPAPSGSVGAGLISFNGKTLVMADAIGIRLKATESTKANLAGATVTVNGEDVTALCNIDAEAGNVDVYVGVTMMQSDICVIVSDANGDMCLELHDQIDWIAQKLINADPSNVLAQQVLAYIQAANAYAATIA